jgi:hypothetical protein
MTGAPWAIGSGDSRLYSFSNITAAAAAGIDRIPQLRRSCQGKRYGPSRLAVRTVYHSANYTCRSTLLQLCWTGRRVGPTLYGLRPLWSQSGNGRRSGPSGKAVRTVHHSANYTCRSTLLQLCWTGRRVGPAPYGLRPLWSQSGNGRRSGPSGQAVRTVHHSANYTCRATLRQLF